MVHSELILLALLNNDFLPRSTAPDEVAKRDWPDLSTAHAAARDQSVNNGRNIRRLTAQNKPRGSWPLVEVPLLPFCISTAQHSTLCFSQCAAVCRTRNLPHSRGRRKSVSRQRQRQANFFCFFTASVQIGGLHPRAETFPAPPGQLRPP